MSRVKTKLEKDVKKTVLDLEVKRTKILSDFAKAYMIENDFLPSQIRLVEKQEGHQVSWFFAPQESQVK